jgi:hypothetical protein
MLEQTKNKSLDELEDLIGRFSREYADYTEVQPIKIVIALARGPP